MSTSATPPDWPTLLRPQSVLKDGSLGRTVGAITKSGSTYATPCVRAAQPSTSCMLAWGALSV